MNQGEVWSLMTYVTWMEEGFMGDDVFWACSFFIVILVNV